jgi:hypothetical protein
MTESEARFVLGVDSSADLEDILEAYEEAVFEQASFFMLRVFIPKLAEARIKKLEAIRLAAKTLGLEEVENIDPIQFDFSAAKNHQEVIEAYNKAEIRLKLQLANASSSAIAKSAFQSWLQLFEGYANSFQAFCIMPESEVQVKLTQAPIFIEYWNATEAEKAELVQNECARLKRLIGN